MSIPFQRAPMILAGFLSLFLIRPLSAQPGESEEVTWYDELENRRSEVAPLNLKLLSIQVSKLPRDTFGHGKPPWGDGFVSSFVAASGTAVYGVFELDPKGDLEYREKLTSLEAFTDDRGKDLTENPGGRKINEFFDSNKPVSIQLSGDQTKAIFTIRGYSTPTRGARSVSAAARVKFVSFSQERTRLLQIDSFEARQSVEVGPLSFTIHKAGTQTFLPSGRATRTVNPTFGDEGREWALQINPRQKPVKSVELLDGDKEVIRALQGLKFNGKSHRYYLEKLSEPPKWIRVTWYEKWELISVPLKIETSLGI